MNKNNNVSEKLPKDLVENLPKPQRIKTILIICSGNICRSPMAHGYLEKQLAEKGLNNISVTSAGTFGFNGNPASHEAVLVGDEIGFDINQHRSTGLTSSLAENADIILVMTQNHKQHILDNYPLEILKTFLLGEFSKKLSGNGIMDPYQMDQKTYFKVFSEIKFRGPCP